MASSSRHDLHNLACQAEAEYHASARACEVRVQNELERRRREMAAEASLLMHRIRRAAGV
jgi:hypothetical protein